MHRKCLALDEVEKLVDTVFVFYITHVARIEPARNLLAAYTISSKRCSREYTYQRFATTFISIDHNGLFHHSSSLFRLPPLIFQS